ALLSDDTDSISYRTILPTRRSVSAANRDTQRSIKMNKTALAALLLACAITILATSAPHCPDLKCPGTEVCRATSCACGSYRPDC
ncbi:hypothetical protein BIW11_11923, partial [Tropilaelaps mercedesae]